MKNDIVIHVDGVYKDFKLPHEKVNSIKTAFTSVNKKKVKTSEIQHALKDISFDIKKGEFFGILGRNGSGKSTLLKIIAEIYQPTKGSVEVKGKLVPFIELGVGFNPELTGRENVYLNGALLGFTRKEINDMYDDIVEFAELGDFMEQKLKNYSSGMQVRLAFSVATRAEADVLLVDEVLAVGDADFQRKCFEYFRELKKAKKTVVFVSHDMGSVREYCDRAILIEKSELIYSGRANEVADRYTKLFIGTNDNKKTVNDDKVGNNKITINTVATRQDQASDEVIIEVDCTVNEDIDHANLGFKLKDPFDRPLLGTNTNIAQQKLLNLKSKDTFKAIFKFANILNNGKYALDVAVESSTGEMYSWWTNAASIEIKKEKLTGFPVEPNINVEINAK